MPLRGVFDGYTYFGSQKRALRGTAQFMNIQSGYSESDQDCSRSSGPDLSSPEGYETNEKSSEIVNDFVIPTRRVEDRKPGRQFYIRYDGARDDYCIKCIQDYTVFVKTTGTVQLENR